MAVGTTAFPTALDTAVELVELTNNASSALTSGITNSQTTITVNDPSEFASSGFATITDDLTTPTKTEIISYTGKSGSDLTGVTRGVQGTTGQAFTTGYVECRPTKGHHEALRGAIIAIETKLGYGSDTAANGQVLIGNGAGTSEWRALIAGDLPDLSGTYQPVDADLTAIAALSSDGFLKKTGGTWGMDATAYGTGSVTSVGLSLPAIFTVSNSPVTTTGTLTGTLADQNANVVFAGPTTGAATAPTFRALVAADVPGVLSVTKLSNLTSNGFVKTSGGDGTLSVDTSTYLTANQSITLSGDVTGSGTTAITATIANDAVTYAKLQNVSATARILGRKTASAGDAEECTLSEILDFVGSAAQGDILYRGASEWTRLGAGTNGHYLQTQGAGANPQWAAVSGGGLTVGTTAIASGTAGRILYETSGNVLGEIAGSSVDANGAVQFAASARSSGVAQYFRVNTPADTGLTADTESVGAYFGGNGSGATVTREWVDGTITTQREFVFVAPTYNVAAATRTITTAATVAITGAPIAASGTTITNPLALQVASGRSDFPAGTAGAPSITFGQSNTGIYQNTSPGVDVAISGTRVLAVSGTSLYITQNTGLVVGAAFDTGLARTAAAQFRISNGSTGAGKLIIGSSSASTSAADMYVVGSSASLVPLRVDSASSPSADVVQFTNNGTNRWALNSSTTATTRTMTGPNGGTNVVGVLMESITLSTSGTTTDSTIDLPANSIILSVTGRITTTITTATDWKLGDATVSDRFSDANATLTSGTTTVGINQWKADRTTAGQGAFQQSTAKVRITTTGTPGAGVIRIMIHYITLTAPTS